MAKMLATWHECSYRGKNLTRTVVVQCSKLCGLVDGYEAQNGHEDAKYEVDCISGDRRPGPEV